MQRINKRGADKAPYFFALCMSIWESTIRSSNSCAISSARLSKNAFVVSSGEIWASSLKWSMITLLSAHSFRKCLNTGELKDMVRVFMSNFPSASLFPLVSRYTGALPPNTPSHNILQNDYLTNSATKRNRWRAILQCPHGEEFLKGEFTILIERTVEIRWWNMIKWNW